MSQAAEGNNVKIHYTVKLKNGDLIETSQNRNPLEVELGKGNVIPGLEAGIYGMELGESKTLEIPPEQGFGLIKEELMVQVLRSEIPSDIDPKMGQKLQIQQKDGDPVNVMITEVNDDSVTLDANHPFAGHTLICDIQLVEIGR